MSATHGEKAKDEARLAVFHGIQAAKEARTVASEAIQQVKHSFVEKMDDTDKDDASNRSSKECEADISTENEVDRSSV